MNMKSVNWKNLARWPTGSCGPIGIDLGAHTVKAVQVRRNGEAVSFVATASLVRRSESETIQEIAGRLQNVLQRQNFRGRDVVLAAPAKRLESDLLELPPRASGAPLETLARVELGRSARLDAVPFEMACWDLPTADRPSAGTSMMAVALRCADAEELVDQFAAAGLIVRAIDAAACACSRVVGSAPDEQAMTAVVDLGWTGFRLSLIGRGIVTYQRLLSDAGLAALHQEVAKRIDVAPDIAQFAIRSIGVASMPDTAVVTEIDPGEAMRIRTIIARHVEVLATELAASFAFAAHRFPELPLKRLVIGGGGSLIPGLTQAIGSRLKISAEAWHNTLSAQLNDPTLMVATGLSLYEED